MHRGDHAETARRLHQRRIVEWRVECTEPGLGKPQPDLHQFFEIGFGQAGLQNHRAGVNAHAARSVVEETFPRGEASAFTPAGSLGRPGTCTSDARDGRRRSAMQIAFQIPHRALPGRVVAERDVNVAVDEARYCGGRPPHR